MAAAAVDLPLDGARQLERASRLLDFWSSAPRGSRTPVHKSLEQLFLESRARAPPAGGALGSAPFGPAGSSKLLRSAQAQRLDREVADFALSGAGAEPARSEDAAVEEDKPNLSLREFFGQRYEKALLSAMEELQRDAKKSFEQWSFNHALREWEEAKSQIMGPMGALGPQRVGQATTSRSEGGPTAAAPSQDGAIIDLLLREKVSQTLVQRIAQLSCESCLPYQGELGECWNIVSNALKPTPEAVVCGSLTYLQNRFGEELRTCVYRYADSRLGGIPDAWSLVRAFGRIQFDTLAFPNDPEHVWYAAYVAARAGFSQLLVELPRLSSPCSDRCAMLRTVCIKVARRLRDVAAEAGGPAPEFEAADVDEAGLKEDAAEDGSPFRAVLVALLLGKAFAFGKLPESTVQDWLWFRLHGVCAGLGGAAEGDQAAPLGEKLEGLQQQVLALPPAHYDPAAAAVGGPAGFSDGLLGPSGSAGPKNPGTAFAGVAQTLNYGKVLLLTAQFSRAVQHLRAQDRCLLGPALHMALVLHRCGSLAALEPLEKRLKITALVREYAEQFSCGEQLQYYCALDPPDRAEALQSLLLRGGAGACDELLGQIDASGRHRPGLLEKALHGDGLGDRAEFTELCARAGRAASDRGQYREALRLLHLGKCHGEVLQGLCRCLRLPVWREASTCSAAAGDVLLLAQDLERFFSIYERNLDRYALSSQSWAAARKLYAARLFHTHCDQGRPEAALDVFDREQLLPFRGEDYASFESEHEVLSDAPRIIRDYVQILRYAASQGVVNAPALRARVRQLQCFLALHSRRLTLDQATVAALASLAFF